MMNVGISTPTAGSVKAGYTASLLGLVTFYLDHVVRGREDEPRSITYNLLIGSNIAQQREQLVEDVLRDPGMTHVLFIDDDMGYKNFCLNLALARRQPVVLANYRRKAPPWAFTARNLIDGKAHEVVTHVGASGLEEVTFGGFGFCLIEAWVIRKIAKPRFLNRWIEHQQLYSTEDYPFFQAIHDQKLCKVYVDHDLSRNVFHIGDFAYHHNTAPRIADREQQWSELNTPKEDEPAAA